MGNRNTNGRKKVTIQDVSQACGLSSATVSRVLSNKDHVQQETHELVMRFVEQLGYEYVSKGTSPRQSASKKVMIVVDDISLPFYISIMQGAIDALDAAGYSAMILQTSAALTSEAAIKLAQQDGFVGVILVTAVDTPSLAELLRQSSCPVVLANRDIYLVDTTSVCTDEFGGAYKATKFLLENGHTHIACLAGPETSNTCVDQRRGYSKALEEAGIQPDQRAIYLGTLKSSAGKQFARFFMEHLPDYTAVFCANEVMAVALMDELMQNGYSIPADVSVICFDDTYIAVSSPVKLTTVSGNGDTMGRVAAELLTDIICGSNSANRTIILPTVLTQRDSVSAPRPEAVRSDGMPRH